MILTVIHCYALLWSHPGWSISNLLEYHILIISYIKNYIIQDKLTGGVALYALRLGGRRIDPTSRCEGESAVYGGETPI